MITYPTERQLRKMSPAELIRYCEEGLAAVSRTITYLEEAQARLDSEASQPSTKPQVKRHATRAQEPLKREARYPHSLELDR
jgi:hypothetical protein